MRKQSPTSDERSSLGNADSESAFSTAPHALESGPLRLGGFQRAHDAAIHKAVRARFRYWKRRVYAESLLCDLNLLRCRLRCKLIRLKLFALNLAFVLFKGFRR